MISLEGVFQSGMDAFALGERIIEDPYLKGTREFDAWADGWANSNQH
jgi:hypothetical protein